MWAWSQIRKPFCTLRLKSNSCMFSSCICNRSIFDVWLLIHMEFVLVLVTDIDVTVSLSKWLSGCPSTSYQNTHIFLCELRCPFYLILNPYICFFPGLAAVFHGSVCLYESEPSYLKCGGSMICFNIWLN
jgi:hypothetical protein